MEAVGSRRGMCTYSAESKGSAAAIVFNNSGYDYEGRTYNWRDFATDCKLNRMLFVHCYVTKYVVVSVCGGGWRMMHGGVSSFIVDQAGCPCLAKSGTWVCYQVGQPIRG